MSWISWNDRESIGFTAEMKGCGCLKLNQHTRADANAANATSSMSLTHTHTYIWPRADLLSQYHQMHSTVACELVRAKAPLAWDHSPRSVALARQGLSESYKECRRPRQ